MPYSIMQPSITKASIREYVSTCTPLCQEYFRHLTQIQSKTSRAYIRNTLRAGFNRTLNYYGPQEVIGQMILYYTVQEAVEAIESALELARRSRSYRFSKFFLLLALERTLDSYILEISIPGPEDREGMQAFDRALFLACLESNCL